MTQPLHLNPLACALSQGTRYAHFNAYITTPIFALQGLDQVERTCRAH
ncbi:hypothetical protein HALA3H3_210069 [Halomonas sp. A3H3]|nr:hypothetical protein HALA3H3_210069 [Halomonas sp. A3H3]